VVDGRRVKMVGEGTTASDLQDLHLYLDGSQAEGTQLLSVTSGFPL
jgi:hypothetical protein